MEANLRIESAIRVSVSERCVIGVGGTEVRSVGLGGVSGEAERVGVVLSGRYLQFRQ